MFKQDAEDIATALVAEMKNKKTNRTHLLESEMVGLIFPHDKTIVSRIPKHLKPIKDKSGTIWYRRFEVNFYLRELEQSKLGSAGEKKRESSETR